MAGQLVCPHTWHHIFHGLPSHHARGDRWIPVQWHRHDGAETLPAAGQAPATQLGAVMMEHILANKTNSCFTSLGRTLVRVVNMTDYSCDSLTSGVPASLASVSMTRDSVFWSKLKSG